MARGVRGTRGRALRTLSHRTDSRSVARCLYALAGVGLLAACAGESTPPTLAPAPTLAVVTATPGPPPIPTPGQQQRYVVREGDTLSEIAARFGVSEQAILEANPLSDPNRLLVGQELIIPPAQPSPDGP